MGVIHIPAVSGLEAIALPGPFSIHTAEISNISCLRYPGPLEEVKTHIKLT